ncbi:AAA family ATPase [Patescibacteria group bacterium]|nr:AAA family ATPase [Patescibacteria group bacterium]MBU1703239.1 AAA family ATPase [Patescibacteria group bacterium]
MDKNLIEQLRFLQDGLVKNLPTFRRAIMTKIDWNFPLVAIMGQRGVGKTTLILQRLKEKNEGVYFSCDNVSIIEHGLFQLVYDLYKEYSQRIFYIDEVHKYPGWTQEIKNITDSFPEAHVVITGSSSIDIIQESHDLSRRVLLYPMNTLSLREFLAYKYSISIPEYQLDDIFIHGPEISYQYAPQMKQIYFMEYLKEYSYFYRTQVDESSEYFMLLENAVKKTIYEDISRTHNVESKNLLLFEKILYLLSSITPTEMSYTKIAQKLQIDPKTTEYYCTILEKAGLIHIIKKQGNITQQITKDKKILLSNTNLAYLYNLLFSESPNIGMLREIFFIECIKRTRTIVSLHSKYDYLVEHKTKKRVCEIGGKNKTISSKDPNTYIIADDILVGTDKKIPLWLFGLV